MSTAAVMNPSAFQSLPIKLIDESPTNPRKHFDEEALKELAESLRSLGQLQPVLVRPKGARFELVFGHRRLRAAKLAGLEQMQAIVRELTDLAVLKAQLVENLRRTDIHALEEAEGYRRLHVDHKLSVDEIAQETGKSKATIHARLKLCELTGPCRKAFEAGEISMSIALELARVKIPSAEQPEVIKELLGGRYADDGPMPYRQAVEFLRGRFMLDLKKASFDTADPDLVKSAGACTTCPHRTGNQKDLFADVKNADVCTKPVCHAEKVEADWQAKAKAGEEGRGPKVISAKDATKMFASYGGLKHGAGVLDLDAPCYEDPKHRTYRQLIGTDAKKEGAVMMARDPHDGKVVELVPAGPAKKLLKEKLPPPPKPREPSPQQKAAETRERKAEEVKSVARDLAVAEIVAKAEAKELDKKFLLQMVKAELDMSGGDEAWDRRGWPQDDDQNKRVEKLSLEQLRGLLVEMMLGNQLRYHADQILGALGLDPKKLEAKAKKQLEAKEAAKGKCSQCGCTDTKPCKEGCAWVNADETLCTACVEPNHDDKVKPKKGSKPGLIVDVEDGETEEAAEARHKAKRAKK